MLKKKILSIISSLVLVIVVINPLIVPISYTLAETLPLSYVASEELINPQNVQINDSLETLVNIPVQDTSTKEAAKVLVAEEVKEIVENNQESNILNATVTTDSITKTQIINNIELNKTYTFFLNSEVRITFTNLPSGLNNLTIQELELTQTQINDINSASSKAYSFTSNMLDGTFEYTLVLPNYDQSLDAQVAYSEDITTITEATEVTLNVTKSSENIILEGLNHFTVFYVINPNLAGNGNTSNDNCSTVTLAGSVTCYTTIQAAINAAATTAGAPHTINLAAGTYTENLVITNDADLTGLTINGNGIVSTIIVGNLYINGGALMENQTISNLTLRGAPGILRGLNLAYNVYSLRLDTIKMENYDNFALSFDNNADIRGLEVVDSIFFNNQITIKSSSNAKITRGIYETGFDLIRTTIDGNNRANSFGIYTAGDEVFIPSFGNPSFEYMRMNSSIVRNTKYGMFMEVTKNAQIFYNLFESNEFGIVISKYNMNGSAIDGSRIAGNTFTSNGVSKYFIKIDSAAYSVNESGPTEGVEDLYFDSNKFTGATIAAIALGKNDNSGFKNAISVIFEGNNHAFFKNEFYSNLTDIDYNLEGFDLDARSTLAWSGGNPITQTNSVEKRLIHDCEASPFLHGVCDTNNDAFSLNDRSSDIGSINYTEKIYADVSNFSLEESNQSITVRWPEVEGADGYRIYVARTVPGLETATPIFVVGCPDTGVNNINECEYKITGLANVLFYYVNIKAELSEVLDTEFTNPSKYAIPWSIVLDDDGQFAQEGIDVGLYLPTNNIRYSSLRGTAPIKSDELYDAVGEDKYAVLYDADGGMVSNMGLWKTSTNLLGYYDVYVTYQTYNGLSDAQANSNAVTYSLRDNDPATLDPVPQVGSDLEVVVNQRLNDSSILGASAADAGWIYLGTYFYGNTKGFVTLGADTRSGNIQMDAVAFQKRDDLTKIIVIKSLTDQMGDFVQSSDTFNVTLNGEGVIGSNTGVISYNGLNTLVAEFDVTAGEYSVEETTVAGYDNLGCKVGEGEDLDSEIFTITNQEFEIVVCENQITDLIPSVTINATPGESTTAQAITLTANILGGNLPTVIQSWGNGNFGACSGTTASIVTPSTPGTYTCEVTVIDEDGDVASAIKTVVVNATPVVQGDLVPTIVLFGNAPTTNSFGNVLAAANTNFTITSSLNNLGNANYNFAFAGICAGSLNNTPNSVFISNNLNLAVGNYICSVSATDTDGDVALASVNVIVTTNGFGGPGPQVQGVTTTEPTIIETTDDSDILGVSAQTCETFEKVSGSVFKDIVTVNNRKDNSEQGVEDVELTIFTFNEKNEEVVITKVKTNRIGYWEANLCAGNYSIRLNEDNLPENTVLGGSDTFTFSVIESEDKADVNFAIYDINNAGFNWWILLLILLIILLGAGGYVAYNSRNKEEN